MMRTLLLSLVLMPMPAIGAFAQQTAVSAAAADPKWQRVQALPVGTSLMVHARKSHANCTLTNVDADTLTCVQKKYLTFQRADILKIEIPRRGRSALIGLGIGGGIGVVVGAASGCSSEEKNSAWGCFLTPTRAQGAAIAGVVFGGIGAAIGAATDIGRSTVYTAQ